MIDGAIRITGTSQVTEGSFGVQQTSTGVLQLETQRKISRRTLWNASLRSANTQRDAMPATQEALLCSDGVR